MAATTTQLSPVELSVVMPCFNESEVIETLLKEWIAFLDEEVRDYEIIVVNDGSSDGTGRILDKVRREHKTLRVIHQLNLGAARAIRRGYETARGKYVLQVTSDGRYETCDFLRLWQQRQENALVLGARTHRLDPLLRRTLSHLLRRTVKWAFKQEISDSNVPFRLTRRDLATVYLSQLPPKSEAGNVMMAAFLKRDYPDRVVEVPVPHRLRARGKRGPRTMALLGLAAHIFSQIMEHRRTAVTSDISSPSPVQA